MYITKGVGFKRVKYVIAPKIEKGWLAMDRDDVWWFFPTKPKINEKFGFWTSNRVGIAQKFFNISTNIDWKKTLIKTGL